MLLTGGLVARARVGVAAARVRRVVRRAGAKVGTIVRGRAAGVDAIAAAVRIAETCFPWRIVSTAAATSTAIDRNTLEEEKRQDYNTCYSLL